jgi:hypothetical protein
MRTATQEPKLQVTFGGLRSKNIEQLKMLNAAIFPIKYQVPPLDTSMIRCSIVKTACICTCANRRCCVMHQDGFYRECCAAGDVTQLGEAGSVQQQSADAACSVQTNTACANAVYRQCDMERTHYNCSVPQRCVGGRHRVPPGAAEGGLHGEGAMAMLYRDTRCVRQDMQMCSDEA